jgi:hypothetical protein
MSVRPALRRVRWAAAAIAVTALFGCQSVGLDDFVATAAIPGAAGVHSSNWHVDHYGIGADRYVFSLSKNRLASGGDGEAMQVLLSHAHDLALEQRYSGFKVIEFTQGIESTLPLARRVSRGVVQFARTR